VCRRAALRGSSLRIHDSGVLHKGFRESSIASQPVILPGQKAYG